MDPLSDTSNLQLSGSETVDSYLPITNVWKIHSLVYGTVVTLNLQVQTEVILRPVTNPTLRHLTDGKKSDQTPNTDNF